MRSFLKNLFRNIRIASKASVGKPSTRRANLQIEGLEDRRVLSSAVLNSSTSTLTIDLSPNVNVELVEVQANGTREIEVVGISNTSPEFKIDSINTVVINASGQDNIEINDSGGMPFATNTVITFQGGGTDNSINFFGSRAIDTGVDYVVGGTASSTPSSSILMDGLDFKLNSAYTSVTDTIQATGGPLDVSTSGLDVVLSSSSSSNGVEQTLSGMGPGGGGTFTYANMSTVDLSEFAKNATVTLDATSVPSSETQFSINLEGANEQATVVGTPNASNFLTAVTASGSVQRVNVQSNLSPVKVQGDSTTTTVIGQPKANDVLSTEGIKANVTVAGSTTLLVSDQADPTSETWDVTESTISGLGVFGNNFAEITYKNVQNLDILTSTGANNTGGDFVNVSGTDPGEGNTQITITDDSTVAFTATITVGSSSALNVVLENQSTNSSAPARLFIDATSGAKFSNTNPQAGNGTENVSYGNNVVAQVEYLDFTSIKLED
jgi:hypothetical protein